MRKGVLSAAATAASVALLTVGAPTVAQAYTEKELSICFVNTTSDPVTDLEVVADGPSFKTATLDAGECAAWNVRPGRYKITLEDIDDLIAHAEAGEFYCPKGESVGSDITVERMRETYKQSLSGFGGHGSFTTDVKKDRRTAVTISFWCQKPPVPEDVP